MRFLEEGGVSRRTFMAGLGATGLGLALDVQASTERNRIILGAGSHKYEWIPNWAKLPKGKTFAPTHGCVQADSNDNIYVNTDNKDAVIVFNKDGKFLKSWGSDISGGGSAHGMQVVKEGKKEYVWIAHTGKHKVFKATLDGKVVMTIGWPEMSGVYKKEGEYKPTMVCVAPGGEIFVGDGYGKSFVHKFKKNGDYVKSWNGGESPAGRFRTPHALTVRAARRKIKSLS